MWQRTGKRQKEYQLLFRSLREERPKSSMQLLTTHTVLHVFLLSRSKC